MTCPRISIRRNRRKFETSSVSIGQLEARKSRGTASRSTRGDWEPRVVEEEDEKPRAGSDERRRETASGVRREETRNREQVGGLTCPRISTRRNRRKFETSSVSIGRTRGEEEPGNREQVNERRLGTTSSRERRRETASGVRREETRNREGSARERRRETASGVRREETRNREQVGGLTALELYAADEARGEHDPDRARELQVEIDKSTAQREEGIRPLEAP